MREDLTRLRSNIPLLVGLAGLALVVALGVFGQALAPQDPNAQHWVLINSDPQARETMRFPPTMPDREHLLGTDGLGRDQLSRVLAGARLTVTTLLVAMFIRLGLGVGLGLASGWYGGVLERTARLAIGIFSGIPQLVLAIILVLWFRDFGFAGFIVAVALVGWGDVARFVCTEVQRIKRSAFIEAARSLGSRDRWLFRQHVLRSLAPQLFSLAALESGSALLLMAELGLIGLFIAGATYYLNESGLPALPLRDRAPEWGQMLAGIQFYAAQGAVPVLLPAIVVVLAVITFNLLAEGLRRASDPYSTLVLSPPLFTGLGKGLAAGLCLAVIGFAGFNLQPPSVNLADGERVAAEAAARTWPDAVYIGAVMTYSSVVHGMERPQQINYYFADQKGELLRIGLPDANPMALEVRPYESVDGLDYRQLRPLPNTTLVPAEQILGKVEYAFGSSFRARNPGFIVRVILTWPSFRADPTYEVTYATSQGPVGQRACCYDALSGAQVQPTPQPSHSP